MLGILSSIPLDTVQFLAKSASDFCGDTAPIWRFVGQIVRVLQIVIPVIIILLGTIDLGKAVMAGEDKKIKEAQKMLLMRIIYGVAIFFVVMIVKVVFGMVSGAESDSNEGSNKCLACVAKPGSC